ncbi:hypothetical protein BGZ83_009409 [Gryganskiella cystojenkinii]|nr:hypothetical protein BGZ83_009409 [Gryganskiella cystojenkinii]
MKLTVAAVLASCAPSLGFALIGINWSITNVPDGGLTNVAFPFSIAQAPHKSGYNFAQQFSFIGQQDFGYIGIQPRPDAGGEPVIHAVFSSFIAGTKTNDDNCTPGAQGIGVSCDVEFSAAYADSYILKVQNTQGTTWSGTLVDTTTDKSVPIGVWTLPDGTGGIQKSQVGFVDYYPWNTGSPTCSELPDTTVAFGVPTSTTSGRIGALSDAYEYGDCAGNVKFNNKRTSDQGVEISVGFKLTPQM